MARAPLAIVKETLDGAREAPKVGRRSKAEEQRELPLLPAGCPVTPLGKSGQLCHYLDEAGQWVSLKPGTEHGRGHIENLFGRQSHLLQTEPYWPKYSAKVDNEGHRILDGFKADVAGRVLMAACAHAGLFDPQGKVRGRGAWAGQGGELILHCGDKLYRPAMPVGEGWCDPGKIDGFVYPTAAAMPRPDPIGDDGAAGEELLDLLRRWHWERPTIDPWLLLGGIAHFPFGGACEWRSMLWVTGDTKTGKSTLELKLLQWLFDGASLRTHQATEAAIRQLLGHQTLPVFFDEIEAEAGSDRAEKVIALARLASSGGVIFRGGADHKGSEFIAQSCFYFSSVLMPPTLAQDRNRMAILELMPIPRGAKPPMIERSAIVALGRRLRRRVIDQWWRLEPTLAAYKQALAAYGHSGRSADQFGTLLTFADLAMFEEEPDAAQLEHWGEALRADQLAEIVDNASDSEEACEFLGTSMLQLRGGDEPEPLRRLIAKAIGLGEIALLDDQAMREARRRLENHGMKLVVATPTHGDGKAWGARDPTFDERGDMLYLAIANRHQALARLFRDQRWAKGVWSQTFGRTRLIDEHGEVRIGKDGHELVARRRVQVRMARKSVKATLVPIGALLDAEEMQ
jgi:hypothetical protein